MKARFQMTPGSGCFDFPSPESGCHDDPNKRRNCSSVRICSSRSLGGLSKAFLRGRTRERLSAGESEFLVGSSRESEAAVKTAGNVRKLDGSCFWNQNSIGPPVTIVRAMVRASTDTAHSEGRRCASVPFGQTWVPCTPTSG